MTAQIATLRENDTEPPIGEQAPLPDLHDRITEAYFGKLGEAFARSTRERIHWICSQVEGMRVLDVGCSQGIASIILGRERKSVTGIDIAKRSIDEARGYLSMESRHVQDSVTFLHGDFKTADLGQSKFDTVIMSEVLEHLSQPGVFVESAAERLEENGTLIVTVPFGVNDWPDHKQTFYLLEPWRLISTWFEIGEVRFFGKWIGFVGRKRGVPLDDELMPPWDLFFQSEDAIQKLERSLLERVDSLSDRIRDFQSKLQSANSHIASLTENASKSDLALRGAEERISALQAETTNRSARARHLEGTIGTLEGRIELARAEQISAEREIARLSAELSAAERTAEQYRVVSGQYEQSLERERGARIDAEKKALLAEHGHQEAVGRLEEAEGVLLNKSHELSMLNSRLNQLRAERDDKENEINRLADELEAARAGEFRRREELRKFEKLLAGEHSAKSLTEKKLREAELNASELSKNLARSRDHLASKSAQIDSLLTSIDELQSQIVQRDERIGILKSSLEGAEEAALQWLEELEQRTDELQRLKDSLTASQRQIADMHDAALAADIEIKSAKHRIEILEREKIEANSSLAAALEEQRLATCQAEQALADARRQIVSNEAEAIAMRQTLKAAEEKAQLSHNNFEAVRKELDSEKSLHRSTVSKLEAANAGERSALIRNEDLQRQLRQSAARAMALRSQVQALEREKSYAESRVLKTRNMISFQLGHALIQAGKSWRGFRALPGKLLEISRDARNRRQGMIAVDAIPVPVPLVPSVGRKTFSADTLKALKIACIMDDFTYAAFADEATLAQLSPTDWREQLETFVPEILFIESAWRGKDELWGNKVGHRSNELVGIVEWCRQRNIPTAFWNKEDPVHFETFLNTASLFDHVFTTDIDCIGRYKAALGHSNVWFLPFACPANRFNPIETHRRKNAFSFAGAYYARYPERNRDLESLVSALSEKHQVEIYDRNYGKDDPRYQFPMDFQPFIVGHLPFDKIEEAYKGYTHAINMNSIKQSQSMFARRVFELLGCNTITISNFSRGVRMLFGDLVVCTDSGTEAMRRLDRISDDLTYRKFRLLGLRKVMSEHTSQDRLAYVAAKGLGRPIPTLLPDILVTAYAKNPGQLDLVLANYRRQIYSRKRLCVIVPNGFSAPKPHEDSVIIIEASKLDGLTVTSLAGEASHIAGMVPDDYYGPNYLTDLALGTRYFDGQAVGKSAYFVRARSGEVALSWPGQQYQLVKQVAARTSLTVVDLIGQLPVLEWVTSLFTRVLECDRALSVDEFNYCKNGVTAINDERLRIVDDLPDVDVGLGMKSLIDRAESVVPDAIANSPGSSISGAELANLFRNAKGRHVTFAVEGRDWIISSSLPDGKHDYIYASQDLTPAELGFTSAAKLHLETTPGLNIQFVVMYLDAKKQRVSHEIIPSNHNGTCTLPQGAGFVRLGLRLYGPGMASIKALAKDHKSTAPGVMIGKARHLILTNHYPQYDDLYRNGFVHTRVAAYVRTGMQVDVFRCRPGTALGYQEFENVDFATGGPEALDKFLSDGTYESVGVHFLDPVMWQVLERHVSTVLINVWVHGAEIQPWHRREYNFRSASERQTEMARSDQRLAFWRGLLRKMPDNLHLVFVSKCFAEEVMEDLGFRLPDERYSIVHNPIDTELFSYADKQPTQRKRVLSIRPYASRKYANDQSVAAITALKDEPFFNDIEFRMIGSGELFDETTAPLRDLPNVIVEKRFLTHAEIAALHKEYGVFLTPTRWDSQGVSRDEAMSSGLVPVTSRVAAVPEFVDESCGYLAEPEDAAGLAAAIKDLYENPDKFLTLSRAAAERVRLQSSAEKIITQELSLLKGSEAKHGG